MRNLDLRQHSRSHKNQKDENAFYREQLLDFRLLDLEMAVLIEGLYPRLGLQRLTAC